MKNSSAKGRKFSGNIYKNLRISGNFRGSKLKNFPGEPALGSPSMFTFREWRTIIPLHHWLSFLSPVRFCWVIFCGKSIQAFPRFHCIASLAVMPYPQLDFAGSFSVENQYKRSLDFIALHHWLSCLIPSYILQDNFLWRICNPKDSILECNAYVRGKNTF